MVDRFIYVYLDDILIFVPSSLQEHVQHISRVLQKLLENGLFRQDGEMWTVFMNSLSSLWVIFSYI